jgi:hypothetical protein
MCGLLERKQYEVVYFYKKLSRNHIGGYNEHLPTLRTKVSDRKAVHLQGNKQNVSALH